MATHKERIEFIDLAKGICIVLVVLDHICGEQSGPFILSMNMFRMPLYFVLSGLFFKPYNFRTFIRKKTNKLLIPFSCSFLFIIIPLEFLLNYILYGDITHFHLWEQRGRLDLGQTPAAWFLLCLFIVNIYFYCLFIFCRNRIIMISITGTICGIIGYTLNYCDLYLPMWIDSSLTVLPFFIVGYITRKYSNILYDSFSRNHAILLLLSLSILSLTYYINKSTSPDSTILFVYNIYNINVFSLYVGGIAGTFSVLMTAKYFTHIPIISFIGRYSIVVLLTHQLYIFVLCNILYQLNIPQNSLGVTFGIFVIVILLSLPTIKLCIKYLPYWFAQKDLW